MQHAGRARGRAARWFAWGGALCFLSSLGIYLWCDVRRWGTAAGGPLALQDLAWNGAVFSLFALHHSLFARTPVRQMVVRHVPPGLERACYVYVASLLFGWVALTWRPLPGTMWHLEGLPALGCRLVQGAGIVLVALSARAIDVFELAGLRPARHEATGSAPVFRASGTYGLVRHPIYLGWVMLVWAAPAMTATRLCWAAVSSAYILLAIPLEERSLRAGSAGAYDRYIQQVRWRLLPGVLVLGLAFAA